MLEGGFGENLSGAPTRCKRGHPANEKGLGASPGLFPRDPVSVLGSPSKARELRWLRFAQRVERAGHLALDWLGGVGCDLGRERPDLVRLACKHVELPADEGRLKLDDLGEVLGA